MSRTFERAYFEKTLRTRLVLYKEHKLRKLIFKRGFALILLKKMHFSKSAGSCVVSCLEKFPPSEGGAIKSFSGVVLTLWEKNVPRRRAVPIAPSQSAGSIWEDLMMMIAIHSP